MMSEVPSVLARHSSADMMYLTLAKQAMTFSLASKLSGVRAESSAEQSAASLGSHDSVQD